MIKLFIYIIIIILLVMFLVWSWNFIKDPTLEDYSFRVEKIIKGNTIVYYPQAQIKKYSNFKWICISPKFEIKHYSYASEGYIFNSTHDYPVSSLKEAQNTIKNYIIKIQQSENKGKSVIIPYNQV